MLSSPQDYLITSAGFCGADAMEDEDDEDENSDEESEDEASNVPNIQVILVFL